MEREVNCKLSVGFVGAPLLLAGDFVRVVADHADRTRAGRDALVLSVDDDLVVLTFRYSVETPAVPVISSGPEFWRIAELDLTSVDRSTRLTADTPEWTRVRCTMH